MKLVPVRTVFLKIAPFKDDLFVVACFESHMSIGNEEKNVITIKVLPYPAKLALSTIAFVKSAPSNFDSFYYK